MRSVGWIPTHGAPTTAENPTGLRQRFIDPRAGYRSLLNELLTRPFDRFIIHQPAGWVGEKVIGKRMGGAQYWPIDAEHRWMFERAIRDAMRMRPEITVGIYGSLSLRFTHSIEMSKPEWHVADFDNPRDRWALWQQSVAPWVRAGAYEYWLDNASVPEARGDAVLFSTWLADTHAVRVGIEAFPTNGRGASRTLDLAVMNRVPSLARLKFVRNRDAGRVWDVNDLAYEAIVLVHPHRGEAAPTLPELVSLLRRGFVLGADDRWDEIVQRAYDIFRRGEL